MSLPPVIAVLQANTSEFVAKMTGARESWAATADTIADPAPLLAAQRGLADLGLRASETTRSTAVLGETSREAFRTMSAGAASVLPGLGELVGVTGKVAEQYAHIGEASRAAMDTAVKQSEALKLQIERVTLALDAELRKTTELEVGSRAWTISSAKVAAYRDQILKLNASLAATAAEQKAIAGGAVTAKVGAVGLGTVAVGAAVGVGIGYEAVKAALADEAAEALLKNAVDKTKESFEEFEPHLKDASGQMRNFGFSNADTANAVQKLTTTLHDPEKALNLVGLAANVARARHTDLATAVTLVTKVAAGNVSGLTRIGLASKDASGHTLSAKAAINELGQAYGGAAAAYGSTLQGKWDIFKAQLDDVLARLGEKLIPILTQLLGKFLELATWLNDHVVPVLKTIGDYYLAHKGLINDLVIAFGLLLIANPFAFLAAALVTAYAKSKDFRNIVNDILKFLKPVAEQTWLWKGALVALGGAFVALKIAGLTKALWDLVAAEDAAAASAGAAGGAGLIGRLGALAVAAGPLGVTAALTGGIVVAKLWSASGDSASASGKRLADQNAALNAELKVLTGGIQGTASHMQAFGFTNDEVQKKINDFNTAHPNQQLTALQKQAIATANSLIFPVSTPQININPALNALSALDNAALQSQAIVAAALDSANRGAFNMTTGLGGRQANAAALARTGVDPALANVQAQAVNLASDYGAGLSNATKAAGGKSSTKKAGGTTAALTGNAATIASFLAAKGLTQAQIAGVLGNFQVESGFNPTAYNAKEGAIGIAQWEKGRRVALDAYAKATGGKETSLQTQLGYLWKELTGSESGALSSLKKQGTAGGAAASFDINFERSTAASRPKRVSDAQALLGKLANTNTSITTGAAAVAAATMTGKALASLLAQQKSHDASLVAALKYKQTFTDVSSLGTDPAPGQAAVLKLQDAAAVAALKATLAQSDAATIAKGAGDASAAAIKARAAADTAAAKAATAQDKAELAAAKQAAAEVWAQKAAELAAAKQAAADLAAQNAAAVLAAKANAMALALANKAAENAAVSIFDSGVLNRGLGFAQTVAANNAAPNITINVAGHVTTERDLLASIHEGLLTYGRTNIGTGLN